MYFYSIGYTSYEECPDITLCHEKIFTSEELEDLIIKSMRDIIPTLDFEYSFQSNFSELLMGYDPNRKNVIDILCYKYGFIPLKYTATFRAFGWASVFDHEDWKEDSKSLTKIRNGVADLKPDSKEPK